MRIGGDVLSIGRGRRYASCTGSWALCTLFGATAVWSRSELLFVCHVGSVLCTLLVRGVEDSLSALHWSIVHIEVE